MRNKKWLLGLAFLGLGFVLAGCGKSATSTKELSVTLPDEPMTVDPNKQTDTNSAAVILQSMEGLYRYDKNNKLTPGVATKVVTPTNNGKTYTFNLRKDAKWSNGQPVTAQDFVTSFRRNVDPKTKSQYSTLFAAFKNYTPVSTGKISLSKLGVQALGKYKLRIQLSTPVPYFNDLAADKFLPLNTAAVKKYGQSYGTSSSKAVYDGAYKVVGWTGSNSSFSYQKNNYYWNKNNVKVPKVNVTVTKDQNTAIDLFKSGKIQETTVTGQYVRQNKNDPEMKTHLLGRLQYLYFNNKKNQTNSENLRKAFSLVVDRNTLTNNVLEDGSKPALSAVPVGDMKNPKTGQDMATEQGNLLKTDVAQAKQYWNKYLQEKGTKNVTLDLLTDNTDADRNVGQYVQQVAEKNFKGLKVTLTQVPHAQHVARDFAGQFEMNLTGWSTNWLDASDFLSLAQSTNTVNFTHWKDAQFDSLLKQANAKSGYARYQGLMKANQYLMSVQGFVPLYQPAEAKLVSKKVGGLNYSLLNEAQYQYAYWK